MNILTAADIRAMLHAIRKVEELTDAMRNEVRMPNAAEVYGAAAGIQTIRDTLERVCVSDVEVEQDAALLYNMGSPSAAKALLCQDTVFANAFAQAGQPCTADVARWQAAGYRQERGGWVR